MTVVRDTGRRATPAFAANEPCISYLYLAPSDLLIPRVDRQCIMRFCEALSERGLPVEVVSLNVQLDHDEPTQSRDLFEVYGIDSSFGVTILPSRTRQSAGEGLLHPLWRLTAYSAFVAWRLLRRRTARRSICTVLYFKNYMLAIPLLALRRALDRRLVLLFELHGPPTRRLDRTVLSHVDGVVAISEVLACHAQEQLGLPAERLLVAHQGVNLRLVEELRVERAEARQKTGFPADARLVVYTGKVSDSSGEIDLLLRCASHLKGEAELVIVGGREDHVARLRERVEERRLENVRFVGFVAPADVFHYQMAADVLVSYYPGDLSLNPFRSPGKLFEYMASRRPIVTADYPSQREVLSSDSAVFVEKDDPQALAHAIRRVLLDNHLAENLAESAYQDVLAYTWEARAARVHNFVLGILGRSSDRHPLSGASGDD